MNAAFLASERGEAISMRHLLSDHVQSSSRSSVRFLRRKSGLAIVMRPRPQIGRWSTYTVLGLIGYAVAATAIGVIGATTGASVVERSMAIAMPPFGFWAAIAIERRITGVERIVFYRTAIAAWSMTVAVAIVTGARVMVVSDLTVVLVSAFLTFGRVGCFHVACCHGRPARFGVRYTHAHAALGFPRRLVGRRLVPVQLIEAAGSLVLACNAAATILDDGSPGTATCELVAGYACLRFVLELFRGDGARPYMLQLSEAQWTSLVMTSAVALATRSMHYMAVAAVLVVAALAVTLRTRRFSDALCAPRHLDQLEGLHRALTRQQEGAPVTTSAGLRVSVRRIPSGPLDLLWSHDRLGESDVRALVCELALEAEILASRSEGMFHVFPARLP